MPMECPFRSAAVPPCQIAVHPFRDNVRYCEICQEDYDIRDVGYPAFVEVLRDAIVAIAVGLFLLYAVNNRSVQVERIDPLHPPSLESIG